MRSRSDLGKAAVVVGWVALQGALVLTAGSRPEHAFGFRMFDESSQIEYTLLRLERGPGGATVERACPQGRCDGIAWSAWVPQRPLHQFDREISASYSVAAQLQRLEAALHWFTERAPVRPNAAGYALIGWTARNGGVRVPFRFEARR